MNPQLSIFLQHLSLDPQKIHYMMTPAELIEATIQQRQGVLDDTGALCIDTGKFTGRSPKDRFIVKDEITTDTVDWGAVNKPFEEDQYQLIKKDILDYIRQHDIYIHDGYVCSDDNYRLNVRVLAEYPWSALFANNMFLRLKEQRLIVMHRNGLLFVHRDLKLILQSMEHVRLILPSSILLTGRF